VSATTKPRTIVVCLPTNSGSDWSAAVAAVDGHTTGPAVPSLARFPVRHRKLIGWVTRFTTRHLLGAERHLGVVTRAAGGRRSRLHLQRAQHAAWYQASARWAIWKQVTHGLRQGSGWDYFLRRHLADPKKVPLDQARKQFLAQPMISAMLAYNANPATRWELDPYEVDAYLAGSAAYATKHMLAAVCGDAMFTTDGQWLQPVDDSFAEICAYLKAAASHIHQLNRHAMVVAMTTP
jgi:hypothetical protein